MMRARYAAITGLAAVGTIAAALLPVMPRLVWNATASAPIGLYRLYVDRPAKVGDLVAARPPADLADWMARRRYLPLHVPLMKRVAAVGGQRVCRNHETIRVDGGSVATARLRDHAGRSLPRWSGCRTLGRDELFLLNAVPDSLDGRYFGLLKRATVLGRAVPLWLPEPAQSHSASNQQRRP